MATQLLKINFETLIDKQKESYVIYFKLDGLTYHFYFEQFSICNRYVIGGPGHPRAEKRLHHALVSESKTEEGCVEQIKKFMHNHIGDKILSMLEEMEKWQDIRNSFL